MGGFFGVASKNDCITDVFFGTDYPMWTAKGELDFLKSMNLPEEDMEKILWKNINEFLGLGLS